MADLTHYGGNNWTIFGTPCTARPIQILPILLINRLTLLLNFIK